MGRNTIFVSDRFFMNRCGKALAFQEAKENPCVAVLPSIMLLKCPLDLGSRRIVCFEWRDDLCIVDAQLTDDHRVPENAGIRR